MIKNIVLRSTESEMTFAHSLQTKVAKPEESLSLIYPLLSIKMIILYFARYITLKVTLRKIKRNVLIINGLSFK